MDDYISREAAIEKTKEFCDVFVTKWTDEKVLAWIQSLPAAADVEKVVRCKNCVYGTLLLNLSGKEYVDCKLDDYSVRMPDDYCSYGERRD